MRTPKYSDTRYQNGYKRAAETDIRRTFNRVRAEAEKKAAAKAAEQMRLAEEEAAIQAEREAKVAPLRKAAK